MRIKFTILMTVFFGMQLGLAAYSQKISIKAENVSLGKLLKEVRQQSGFKIMYNTEAIRGVGRLSVDIRDMDLDQALETMMAELPLDYEIREKTILVKPSPKKKQKNANAVVVQQEIRGRVTGEGNQPLSGVSVTVRNQPSLSTQTDQHGRFVLPSVPPNAIIVLSMVGYDTREISATAVSDQIVLTEVATQIEEVAVSAGYGIRPRSQPTGAITTLTAESFEERSVQTADQVLQGQAPGVRLVNTNGAPGAATNVVIRGIGSINAGTNPLWVVNGVRIEQSYAAGQASVNVLQSLNPEDIESIEVLKDAAATSEYGADGANGVVLITTKSGKSGKTKFRFTGQMGAQTQPFRYDAMDGPNFVEAMIESYANRYEDRGVTVYRGTDYGDPREAGRQEAIFRFGDPAQVGTYDWQGALNQVGRQYRANLTASGGSDQTVFYISAGVNDQGGTVLNSHFNRMTLNTNIRHKATDRLTLDLKTNLTHSRATGQVDHGGASGGTNWANSPFHGGVTTRVTSPIYNPDGTYNNDPDDLAGINYNVVQVLDLEEQKTRQSQLLGSFSATYKISEYLSFRSRWNMDYRVTRDFRFRHPDIPRYGEYGGAVYERTRMVTSWNTDQVFDYARTFGSRHNVSAIFGGEYHDMHADEHSATGRGLPMALFQTINSTAVPYEMGGTFTTYKRAGIFSRMEYDYDKRYTVTASVRYDGNSRFGADRRFGLFYSGGLAWDMTREPFMESAHFVSQLKPRVSYGTTGNSDIGNFAARALFGMGGSYDGNRGMRPSQLGNALLTWEVAHSVDLAVDWGLFNRRVYGTINWFRKDNRNLLLERNLPTNSGFTSITDNVGTVRNQGWEIELGARVLTLGKFNWTSDFNITTLKNEIIYLGGTDAIGNTTRVGHPVQVRWGYFSAGVNPADGRPMWYDRDGNLTYTPSETSDRGVIGSQLPDFYGGWSNRFNYGPVSLSMLFYYEYGRDIYNTVGDQFYRQPHRGRVLSNDMWGRWTQPGDLTDIPRFYSLAAFPGSIDYYPLSTRTLQDGSFIRLKNVRLNYALPQHWLSRAKIQRVSVFLQGENLLTWTAFDGPDPEVLAQTQSYYPQPRTIMGGLTMDF